MQPEVAKTTRVCTYDRAGMGYSEAGPLPRTAEHFAQELHTLLQHAGVPGPYVLVGHSSAARRCGCSRTPMRQKSPGVVLIELMNPGAVGTTAPATPPDPGSRSITDTVLTNFFPARVGLVRVVTGSRGGPVPRRCEGRRELSLQTIRFPRSGFRLAKRAVGVFRWALTLRRPQLGGVPESGEHFLHELMGALGFDAWSGRFLRMILLFHIVVRSISLGCVPWIFLST